MKYLFPYLLSGNVHIYLSDFFFMIPARDSEERALEIIPLMLPLMGDGGGCIDKG